MLVAVGVSLLDMNENDSSHQVQGKNEYIKVKNDVATGNMFDGFELYKKVPRMPLKDIFGKAADESEEKNKNGAASQVAVPSLPPRVTAIAVETPPKLVGVIIRSNIRKAFFVDNDVHNVKRGDLLAGRYRIVAIHADRVVVVDNHTRLKRSIYIKD